MKVDFVTLTDIIIVCGFILFNSWKYIFNKSIESRFVVTFALFFIFQLIYSSFLYDQSIAQSFSAGKYYFIILVFFVFIGILKKPDDSRILVNAYIIISSICATLLVFQVLVIPDNLFLDVDYWKRLNTIRVINSANFIEIGYLFSLGILLSDKESINNPLGSFFSIYNLIICAINIIFVSQTRMSIFIVSITTVIMLLCKLHLMKSKSVKFVYIILVTVGIYCMLTSNMYKMFIDDFSDNSVSVDIRKEEVLFFTNHIFDNPMNLLFGRGMVYDQNTKYLHLLWGESGELNRADIGLIGFIDEFGILFLFFVLWLLYKYYCLIRKSWNIGNVPWFLIAIYCYVVFSMGTLFVFNRARIFIVPTLLFLGYVCNKNLRRYVHNK